MRNLNLQLQAIARAMALKIDPKRNLASTKCPICGGEMAVWKFADGRRIRCNGEGCVRWTA